MSKRATTVTTFAATALVGTLLLSGCGDGGNKDGSSDKIEGAGGGKKDSSSPSASAKKDKDAAENDLEAPEFDFPKGVRADIAGDSTGDKDKDAVLRDHGYALRAIVVSLAKADTKSPLAKRYLWDQANEGLQSLVSKFKKDGKVGTGVYRYYDRKAVVQDDDSATVTYCESERDAFAKVVKTGKVLRTKPSVDDFSRYQARMEKKDGEWKMMTLSARTDSKCER